MENFPISGTNASVRATFRLVLKESTSSEFADPKDFLGKSVVLEPFDFPGMVVVHGGKDESLEVSNSDTGKDSVFRLVAGIDGKTGTASLESKSQEGCFVNYKSSSSIKLSCNSESSDAEFKQTASFVLGNGISQYHPISFVAKGAKRNFILAPLFSLRDESYTVYFNIQS